MRSRFPRLPTLVLALCVLGVVLPVATHATDHATEVVLLWRTVGDDGVTGAATAYDFRYSPLPITESNWALATPVPGEPVPLPSGTQQSLTVSGLTPGTTYYFAFRSRDEAGNWSALSNVLPVTTTVPTATGCFESWTCSAWSPCQLGTQHRTCTDANACGTTTARPLLDQQCTVPPATAPAPVVPIAGAALVGGGGGVLLFFLLRRRR